MLGDALPRPDDASYIDFQDAELTHFERRLESEILAYDTATASAKEILDSISPKLEEARRCLHELRLSLGPDYDEALDCYKAARNEVREAFKQLDEVGASGGPPLA